MRRSASLISEAAFMRAIMLPVFSLVLHLGCGASPGPAPREDLYDEPRDFNRFAMYSRGSEVVGARVDRGGVLGLDVNLGRYTEPDDHALRGFVYGQFVNARVEGNRVEGIVASLPLKVAVVPVDDAVRGQGFVYGRRVDLLVGPRLVGGKVGRCRFNLVRRGPVYAGRRSCGHRDNDEDVELTVPRGLRAWSASERVTALMLLLFLD
jgi:hypothetical protein